MAKGLVILMSPEAKEGGLETGPSPKPEEKSSGLRLEIPSSELPEGSVAGDRVEMSGKLVSVEGDTAVVEVEEAEFMPSEDEGEMDEGVLRSKAEEADLES
jgi:Ran GTPase-activating protein (RanGAP) involved in mRNA processing and transport